MGLAVAAGSLGMAQAAAQAQKAAGHGVDWAHFISTAAPATVALKARLVWEGADLDGDGQADIANPTGQAPRGEDAYGEGRFHASRDGGEREHAGVDYVATAGQSVAAPISGYVSKIGFAYADDQTLRYVEIENPALHISARVFYVDPAVAVGDTVAMGHAIGVAHTLQHRYPAGIIDHVHLEIAEAGRKVDAARLILARNQTAPPAAD